MPYSPLDNYKILIENSPVAMVLYDRDMRIVHLNDEFARLARLDADKVRGRSLYDVAPDTGARKEIHVALLSGERRDDRNVPHQFPGEERPRYSDIRYRPLLDETGNVIGILSAIIDVSEQTYAQQEMQELLGHKEDFLDLSAHELRTPITVIKAFAQLAQRPEFREKSAWLEYALDVIGKHSDHLVNLVHDMIEVSRLGRGPLPLYKEQFDLAELVSSLERDYAPIFEQCPFTIETPPSPVIVEADRNRIGTVFANIIDNAAKYTSDTGQCAIRIALEADDKEAVASIHDNGIGIPSDQQARVFDRFFRASNAGTRSRNGLGLGLYICKNIVEQHKGRIWLNSLAGKGTTFYFALPVARI